MQTFREVDRRVGGGHMYPVVVQYLQATVAPHLFGAVVGADSRTVFMAAGALTEMAGWMAYDSGQPALARQHFNRALDLARIGGDRELCAHILASTSHLASHTHRPDEAIRLARAGQGSLPARSRPPELEARLLAMEARGFAALGDSTATTQILNRAETVLHRAYSAEPSPWISRFDDGSLAAEAARCMQRLELLDEAERHARRMVALRSVDRKRSRAFGQLILASVLLAQGRREEGCAVASDVLEATHSLGSVLVLEQLRELQNVLQPHLSDEAVAEFLNRLGDVLPERRRRYPWIAAEDERLSVSGTQV
jgi:tetratricopeptide (TPR) repeat protein